MNEFLRLSREGHAFQPKSAFSRFPLVQRVDLEGQLRVGSARSPRRQENSAKRSRNDLKI
jgi:hypothetical protein